MIATARNAKIKRANGHAPVFKQLPAREITREVIARKASTPAASPKPSMTAELKIHPLCELLPPLSEEDFKALERDVLDVGVRDDIVLLEGKVLDGRHKYQIARKHGLAFRTREYDIKTDGDPIGYVTSRSLGRNMDGSQKAATAVMFDEELQRAGKKRSWHKAGETATDVMGEHFGVSGRYIRDAITLKRESEELFKDVYLGRMKLKPALSEHQRREKAKARTANAEKVRATRCTKLWELITGDVVIELRRLKQKPSLVFADPRYNIGIDYGLGKQFDLSPEPEYLKWCKTWIEMLADGVAEDGTIMLMIDNRHQAEFCMMMKGAGLHFRNTILWVENFGNYTSGNFTPCMRFVHYFTKHPKRFTWHGDDILIDSARTLIYNDKRAGDGKVPGNVWDYASEPLAMEIPRLVGNDKGRMDFPTQLNIKGIDRIVRAASNPGELVMDCFSGSGTTGRAAIKNDRRFLGIDIIGRNNEWAEKSFLELMGEMGGNK